MLTCSKLIPQGQGLAAVLLKRAATVELDWDVRQKSRFDATDCQGRTLGVFLPRGTPVRGGDVLLAEDGSFIRVQAAPQPVLRITYCQTHGSPFDLTRAAYHLGNRHVPIELQPDHLKIEPDHVLADMLARMHLIVTEVYEAFEPENGAYSAHGDHGDGGHGHDHAHPPAAPAHVHTEACNHGHGHSHEATHAHAQSAAPETANAAPTPRGKPIGVAVVGAPTSASPAPHEPTHAPHVHGPGCGHHH
ncbi:MAG: urease accessory protein UreE [Burkholderiaceae bacterium]|nr:urease accessory protein UreE [Burkholderiaceae bacterium]